MKRNLLAYGLLVVLAGCATTPEQDAAAKARKEARELAVSNVTIVSSITATEATGYQELGLRVCAQDSHYVYGMSVEESCRNDLRERAADLKADLVVIESVENFKCDSAKVTTTEKAEIKSGNRFDCVQMKSRFYKKRIN